MNWNSHKKIELKEINSFFKLNWTKECDWVWTVVIERSGAHKRKQVWNKIERLHFELLMAGSLHSRRLEVVSERENRWARGRHMKGEGGWQVHYWELLVLRASWNSNFFASPDHHLILFSKIIVQTLNWQKCFVFNCSIAELHQTLLFGRVQLKSVKFDGNFIRFFWCGTPCFIQSPHW